MNYNKAIVAAVIAILGSGISAALALGIDGQLGLILSIVAAMLTTAGTFVGVAQTDNSVVVNGIKVSASKALEAYQVAVSTGVLAPPVDGPAAGNIDPRPTV